MSPVKHSGRVSVSFFHYNYYNYCKQKSNQLRRSSFWIKTLIGISFEPLKFTPLSDYNGPPVRYNDRDSASSFRYKNNSISWKRVAVPQSGLLFLPRSSTGIRARATLDRSSKQTVLHDGEGVEEKIRSANRGKCLPGTIGLSLPR